MLTLILCTFLNFVKPHSTPIHGTYEVSYGEISRGAPYKMIVIHSFNSSNIVFYLEAGKGAPSYNSGALYGRLKLNKKEGCYDYLPKDTSYDCQLKLFVKQNKIVIKTVRGDCLFGFGVYADGIYTLTGKKNPTYFINRHGTKTYFNKTTPEAYHE